MNNTLALIKPDAMQKGFKDEIRKDIMDNGFIIAKKKHFILVLNKLKVFTLYIKINHFLKNLLSS